MPVFRDLWHRPRPFTYMESIRTLGPEWARPSFPSAHAHLWGQGALLFAVAYPRFRWPLIVLTLLSLYSRPYVGNHHVLDTLAGVGLGLAVGGVDLLVVSRLGALRPAGADRREIEPQLASDRDAGGS
jgi:membrane-associated phospholipid phosphatase